MKQLNIIQKVIKMSHKFPLSHDSWDHEELEAISQVVKDRFFTMSVKVKKFEEEF